MAKRTIIADPVDGGIQAEAYANAAITPGQVLELLSTGKVQKQSTAGADLEGIVAIEDYLQGNGVSDDYAADDVVLYRTFKKGQEVNLILADGEAVVIGDELEYALAGEVQAFTSGAKKFTALEAVDASDSAATAVASRRIAVRVL